MAGNALETVREPLQPGDVGEGLQSSGARSSDPPGDGPERPISAEPTVTDDSEDVFVEEAAAVVTPVLTGTEVTEGLLSVVAAESAQEKERERCQKVMIGISAVDPDQHTRLGVCSVSQQTLRDSVDEAGVHLAEGEPDADSIRLYGFEQGKIQ